MFSSCRAREFFSKTKYLQIKDQVQVRKVDDEGELPGLMIEEMMESASVV